MGVALLRPPLAVIIPAVAAWLTRKGRNDRRSHAAHMAEQVFRYCLIDSICPTPNLRIDFRQVGERCVSHFLQNCFQLFYVHGESGLLRAIPDQLTHSRRSRSSRAA